MRNRGIVFLCVLILLAAAGCAGLPTQAEKTAREEIAKVESNYRPSGVKPQLPVLTDNSDLADFVKYGLLNNPKVESAFYRWKGSVEGINPAKYPDNVQLSVLDFNSTIDSLMPGIMFTIPAPGKLSLAGESASLETAKNERLFQEAVLNTAFRVKEISYQYWVLQEKMKLTQEILKILRAQEDISLAKVKANEASLLDSLTIQMEEEKTANMLADFLDSQKALTAQFGAALGILQRSQIPKPPANLPFTEAGFSEKEVWKTVQANNPRLALMQNEIEESEVYVKSAYKEYWPDFNIGLMQSLFSGMALTRPLLTLSIPWRKKVAGQIAASQNYAEAAKADFSAEELDLAAMMADGLFRWRQADREVRLYRDSLLPKADAIANITRSGYQAGKTGLADLLGAQRTLLDFSINFFAAQAMREITLNEISLSIAGVSPETNALF